MTADLDDFVRAACARVAELENGDPARLRVRAEMIYAGLPLARRVAARFRHRGEHTDDLCQVAALGLIKAVDRFDPSRDIPFTNFAIPTITGELKRYFRDTSWGLHVTRRLQELHLELGRVTPTLSQQLGRLPRVADLAAHLRRSEREVAIGLACATAIQLQSLNSPVTHGEDTVEFGDTIGSLDTRLDAIADRLAVHQLLTALSRRDQRLLALRFFGNLTQAQIGAELGISQMQVSRLLNQVLAQLRQHLVAEPA